MTHAEFHKDTGIERREDYIAALEQALRAACERIADGPQKFHEAKTIEDWENAFMYPCPRCGQRDNGQYGEYPCAECGLPLEHGDGHASDCAVHNMPALPNGPCDCAGEKT